MGLFELWERKVASTNYRLNKRYSRIINEILQIWSVLSAPLYSTDLIDRKCLNVNFLQTSYNLNINSINNSRQNIFTLSSI